MRRHLLVIGAQRCGTTWLARLLDEHPQVATARPARPEPKVFLSDELTARGHDWYDETWFAHATDEVLLAEKSTSYLEDPLAAERAVGMLGDPLVLVQLRDPVERAVSHWAFSSDNGLEDRPLAEALAANLEGPLPWDRGRTSVSPYAYLERGRYSAYLEPWVRRFGGDLVVVLLEELATSAERVGALYSSLGVDGRFRPSGSAEPVNASSTDKAGLAPGLRNRIRGYFEESDRELAELLGRPLPWRDQSSEG